MHQDQLNKIMHQYQLNKIMNLIMNLIEQKFRVY